MNCCLARLSCCVLLAAVLLTACEQDVYDKGDGQNSYLRADFVEAIVGSDKTVACVVTDDGQQMELATPYSGSWIQKADTLYRALLYYDYKEGKAEVRSLNRVTTLSIRRDALVAQGLKFDPLGLEAAWVSSSGKYLNLGLVVKTGPTAAGAKGQAVGIVLNDVVTYADGTKTCCLQLSHLQNSEPEYYTQRAYLSVPLAELTSDSLRLTVNTYDGVVVKTFCLKER